MQNRFGLSGMERETAQFAGRCGARRQRPKFWVSKELAGTQKGARQFDLPPNKPLSGLAEQVFHSIVPPL
jgi:hypothetical protein